MCYQYVNFVALYFYGAIKSLLQILHEDDVIAYRLIELSASWTPELSSFRVHIKSAFGLYYAKILCQKFNVYYVHVPAGWENIAV